MKALNEAIQRRRVKSNPLEQSTGALEGNETSQEPSRAEAMLEMMPQEEKVKLFEMLKAELAAGAQEISEEPGREESEGPMQMEDSAGELKTTPGEKQALQKGMNMDVAGELADPRFQGDESPRTLSDRVKINIARAFKGKGK